VSARTEAADDAAAARPRAQLRAASLAGERFDLHPSGALWFAAERLVVVADLHLEKASSFARTGQMLPPYDSRATLVRLADVVVALGAERLIALGDSFHDAGGPARLDAADAARLAALVGRLDWTWVVGNHDPEIPPALGGRVAGEVALGRLTLRHAPSAATAPGEVCGHLHPVVRVPGRGRAVRRRCFAGDGARLVLPAFGALAGGLDLADAAFAGILSRARTTAYALGADRVYAIPLASLGRA
jgi:DNA ligase-associated metallophosphoesterase